MKKQRKLNITDIDINNAFIQIDGKGWKKPEYVSLKSVYEDIGIPEDATIKLVEFKNQDVSINNPPELYVESEKPMRLSTDGNFLYVWVTDRWKRVALSNF